MTTATGGAAAGLVTSGVEIRPYGDGAISARTLDGTDEQRWRTVQGMADILEADEVLGVTGLVATYDSLLVEFDNVLTDHPLVARALRRAHTRLGASPAATAPRLIPIPVVFGGEYGPDLPDVAGQLGLTPTEVVRRCTGTDWVVRFLGAPAGAPMMDGSPFRTPVSRCPAPRTRVPAGSVALAGLQAVIYPVLSPGGWRLIGRTPLRLTDIDRTPPAVHRPGDRIRFVSIEAARWRELAGTAPEPEPLPGVSHG
ncbi:5-oxoprolinase subunit B family protein [Streptomyces malaysiensis]|uniref:5-oxoprolinase subunit B family protein n=1 Tax=Streptomyces malaysiensis TaxID=92644 RepID=UPI002B2A372D|nr:allophanate hydrolase subunit 1 [Streptomyces malaysiensis]